MGICGLLLLNEENDFIFVIICVPTLLVIGTAGFLFAARVAGWRLSVVLLSMIIAAVGWALYALLRDLLSSNGGAFAEAYGFLILTLLLPFIITVIVTIRKGKAENQGRAPPDPRKNRT